MAGYVLVLDDDEFLRELLELALAGEGHEVRCAASIPDALALVRQEQPRLVLFDLTLGSQRGEAFVSEYRQLPHTSATLIATSGASDLEQRATQMELDGFLAKPWELDHLLNLVEQAFGCDME